MRRALGSSRSRRCRTCPCRSAASPAARTEPRSVLVLGRLPLRAVTRREGGRATRHALGGGTFRSATTGRPLSTQTTDRMTWLALISLLSHSRLCSSGAAKDGTAEAADCASEPSDPPSCFNRNASRDSMACPNARPGETAMKNIYEHICMYVAHVIVYPNL